jgi:pimeloyl-ACP methyl ester carboxylesterase
MAGDPLPPTRAANPGWLDTELFAGDRARKSAAAALDSRPDMRFIDTPQARLRARVQPGPGDHAIVLLPDAPNTIEHYDPHFAHWAGRTTVIAIEPPGFGFSWARHPDALGYEGTVAAVTEALRALDFAAFVICGPCTQAYTAIGVAAALPDRTLGVVAIQATDLPGETRWVRHAVDPGGWLREPGIGQMAWAQPDLRERLAIDGWYPAAAAPGTDVGPWQALARWSHVCGCTNALATQLQTWFDPERPIRPPVIDCPARILFGAGDRTHRRSDPKGLLTLAPRAEVRLLPAAGHFPDLEDMATFARSVEELLAPPTAP